jgi:GntR family transcriptional regulator
MNILITNKDSRPIYEQISARIKQAIINGDLKEGDAIPSMRFLAKDLRISVITTKRAYEDLEREGFIESYVGKGSFVKKQSFDLAVVESRKELELHLEKAAEKAAQTGASYDELCGILKEKMKLQSAAD